MDTPDPLQFTQNATRQANDALNLRMRDVEDVLDKYEVKRVHNQLVERVVTIVLAGLGLIVALAWDAFLKQLFARVFPEDDTLWVYLVYALILTVVLVLLSVYAPRLKRNMKVRRKKRQVKRDMKSSENISSKNK